MIGSVVIVGGGIAGVSTASALRSGGFTGDLTLVDAGEFPYDRPPLSKDYLAGTRQRTETALQAPHWYDDHKIRLISRSRATALRPSTGEVELFDGTVLSADRVVLATGGLATRLPMGTSNERLHVLRSADDADRLRAALQPGARLLVVGAGLIGAEVASTAVDLGCEVVLIDPVDPPLAAAFGPDVAAWLHDQHTERGIHTIRAAVQSLSETASGVDVEVGGTDSKQTFDVVLFAIGMAPDTALAETAKLHVHRGVIVDHTQATSNRAVLAVGDSARLCIGGVFGSHSEHWEAAQHDGLRAAASILGSPAPAETAPWFWTDRHKRHIEAVGAIATAERTLLRGELGGSKFSVFGLAGDRVVGAVAVDDPTAARAARRLIDRRTNVHLGELADPDHDLRRLVRG